MAILLEGPDNSGKTTLAEQLTTATGFPIWHAGDPATPDDFQERLLTDIAIMQQNIIMDRCMIISETIYATVLGRQQLFDSRQWFRKIQALEQVDNLLIIFCLPPLEQIMDKPQVVRIDEDPNHLNAIQQQQHAIYNAYVQMANAMRLFMNVTVSNPFQQTDELISLARWFIGGDSEESHSNQQH